MARAKTPAGRQKNAAKKQNSTDSNISVSEVEGPASQAAAATAVTDFFKSMNNSVDKRNKDKRQKLQDRHKASVTKLQKEIEETSRANNRKLAQYRMTQLSRLAELIKKRSEVEAKIAADVQELNNVYETVGKEMRELLKEKISAFG